MYEFSVELDATERATLEFEFELALESELKLEQAGALTLTFTFSSFFDFECDLRNDFFFGSLDMGGWDNDDGGGACCCCLRVLAVTLFTGTGAGTAVTRRAAPVTFA